MTAPLATYRLQLHAGFTFDAAAGLCEYLRELGVSHLYSSPCLQAVKGSTHGYDVVDHSQPNSELGGAEAFERLLGALRENQLRLVLDVVPNHMAISSSENGWWGDVLENGLSSRYARYFDVDWEKPDANGRSVVVLPVLSDHYGRVLDAGALTIVRDGSRFQVAYADRRFPLSPDSLTALFESAATRARSNALADLAEAFAQLPTPTATDRASVERRHQGTGVLRNEVERLVQSQPAAADAVDEAIAAVNRDTAALHALLEAQNYRLAWWRRAERDLGYRRFFDVNTLIGLRMEDPQVFADTHRLVLAWVRGEAVDGLRIDHPDGLRDPREYCERLSSHVPRAWIVVEKILQRGESLPEDWPVAGTTGYDFLNRVAGLFVDPLGEQPLTDFYEAFTGDTTDYPRLVREKKLQVLRDILASEVNRLTDLLLEICQQHPRHRDYSRHDLAQAIRELVAGFPVYRTYVVPVKGAVSAADRSHIAAAMASALAAETDLDPALFGFLRDLLTLDITGTLEAEFVARFQQLSAPAMAKGVEDTVFYNYNRFVALNEVGGDPSCFGLSVDDFHAAMREAQARRPLTMVATDTHDAKRSEDVRMRLALLSGAPDAWIAAVRRWSAMTSGYRTGGFPDRNAEYVFYQALVGAWPVSPERLLLYMEKATREAKVHTSWITPDAEYEGALRQYVARSLNDSAFLADVGRFVEPLVRPGYINSLAQTLIKLTAPGVPDIYQGTELWAFHYVDPDNRRPVDYQVRQRALAALRTLSPAAMWERAEEGLPKLWVVSQALHLRARRSDAFGATGTYTPLEATGPASCHVVAFARGRDAITVVPRLPAPSPQTWEKTTLCLPGRAWTNVLSNEQLTSDHVQLSELWRGFPVALLERVAP